MCSHQHQRAKLHQEIEEEQNETSGQYGAFKRDRASERKGLCCVLSHLDGLFPAGSRASSCCTTFPRVLSRVCCPVGASRTELVHRSLMGARPLLRLRLRLSCDGLCHTASEPSARSGVVLHWPSLRHGRQLSFPISSSSTTRRLL